MCGISQCSERLRGILWSQLMGGLYFQIWHKLSMLIDLSSSVSQLLNYHSLTHEPVLSMLFPTDAVECTCTTIKNQLP